ncbi:uncharacterized protein [Dysidea avara]|uniref:uncharacterized protein n=1 Tax=Dysidea avara TaxID=196820 RepID=UPI0033317B99
MLIFILILLAFSIQALSLEVHRICINLNESCVEWEDVLFKNLLSNSVESEFNLIPGTYSLDFNLLINNATNVLLVGRTDTPAYVTIECSNFSSLVISNSTSIEIRNIRFLGCGNSIGAEHSDFSFPSFTRAAVFMYNVSSLVISNVLLGNSCGHGIIGVNIVGKLLLEHVKVYGVTTVSDSNNNTCDKWKTAIGGIILLNLANESDETDTEQRNILVSIRECNFSNINTKADIEKAAEAYSYNKSIKKDYLNSSVVGLVLHQMGGHVYIHIEDTTITNIYSSNGPLVFISYSLTSVNNISFNNISISNTNTTHSTFVLSCKHGVKKSNYIATRLRNSTFLALSSSMFSWNFAWHSIIRMQSIHKDYDRISIMKLNNNLFISNTIGDRYTLFRTTKVTPIFTGLTQFINNTAHVIFSMSSYIILADGCKLFFVNNKCRNLFKENLPGPRYIIKKEVMSKDEECPVQFENAINVIISFDKNIGYRKAIYGNPLYGCKWISDSPLQNILPIEVIKNVTYFNKGNEVNSFISGAENSVCHCDSENQVDCLDTKNIILYPGQAVLMTLTHFNFNVALYTDFTTSHFNKIAPTCNVFDHNGITYNSSNPKIDLIFKNCTTVSYRIKSVSSHKKICLLLLRTATKENSMYAFKINLQNCPVGFYLQQGICTCDPALEENLEGLRCDITFETFFRPPNSWLSKKGSNVIYTGHCLTDYCIRFPSSLQLKEPDKQCTSNRSGIACGACTSGMSAVFGTLRCKLCSNYWLLMMPLYALAGILLVVALFVLNLTVVDGDIYGFIFMVNGLSTHSSRIFPSTSNAAYILVSLANLDLGFEVCFYNGMTQYAATWLRFVFPIYVLLIVAGLAFASRYSVLIEKLTRKRVIPVIATLYLLTYNKIMLETFRGLFSYTVIYYLHSKHTDVYWSVDTSVSVFGTQFALLFVFCLIIFLFVIVPTNLLLIFTKTAYRFRFIVNYLKPFLDVYQAPFKENCSYFLGLEFIFRAIIFACYSFKPPDTAAIYNTILIVYLAHLCCSQPFKSKTNTILYVVYLIYLGAYIMLFIRYFPYGQYPYGLMFNLVVYLAFIQFVGILVCHAWKYILRYSEYFNRYELVLKRCINRCKLNLSRSKHRNVNSIVVSMASCEDFQEELLALDLDT